MIFPRKPCTGEEVTSVLVGQIIDCLRAFRPLQGRNILTECTPGGTIIHGTPGGSARSSTADVPFRVRWHEYSSGGATSDGQWEIYMPPGCCSIGATCKVANRRANLTQHHGSGSDGMGDSDDWYILPIDEDEGAEETVDGSDETFRRFEVVLHLKPRAMIQGVDRFSLPAVPYVYAAGRKIVSPDDETPSDQDLAKYAWGDAETVVVAIVKVADGEGGKKVRTVRHVIQTSVSRTPPVGTSFDLEWEFDVDEDGELSVTRVECVRQTAAAGGASIETAGKTEVTDAVEGIYLKIDTSVRPYVGTILTDVDGATQMETTYALFYPLYKIKHNHVASDMRAATLAGINLYRQ